MNYRIIEAKQILSPVKNAPEKFFGTSFSMNLYHGCQHACIYCDTRSECYKIGDISDIRLKINALELLDKELKTKRKKGTIGFGSMNDCYMPVEQEVGYTRKAIEIINHYKFPIHIITKSNLVTRDIDLLKQTSKVYCAITLTITAANDEVSKIIEPFAPPSSHRFKAIKDLSENGIYCGVIITPILPFITDTEENIQSIVNQSVINGANYILGMMGLTQRKGQREYFHKKLDEHFPGLRKRYEDIFGDNYSCGSPDSKQLYKLFYEECTRIGVAYKMKFYEDTVPKQLSIFENN